MPAYQNTRLGAVAHTMVGFTGPSGYGFGITDQYGSPLLTFLYSTMEEADDARDLVELALAKAIIISTPGQ